MDDNNNQLLAPQEIVTAEQDPLKLDLDDKTFVEVIDKLVSASQDYFKEKDLVNRRQKNEDYYLGKQISQAEKKNELKKYNARYSDNLIYESEKTLKAVAVSRVPDLIIKPGNDSDESRKVAEELTKVVNSKLRKRENRSVLGMAYTHRPIYFAGIIKPRWNDERGRNGDYQYDNVHFHA